MPLYMEQKTWTSPEDVAKTLEALIEDVKQHKIKSIVVVGETVNNDYYFRASRVENCYALAGYLLHIALTRMGFSDSEKR